MTEEAFKHNTPENIDSLFGDINYVIEYLLHGRLQWYGEVIDIFVDRAGVDLTGKRIADVGCATGHALKYIHGNHNPAALFGFDYSKEALKWARKVLPEAKFKFHDLDNPLKEKFDLIMAFEVFEHLYHPELVLANLLDALEDGGMLFLTVPDGETDGFYGHINFWTIDEFKSFCDAEYIGQLDDVLLAIVVKEES